MVRSAPTSCVTKAARRDVEQAAAVAALTGGHLDGLAAGQPGHLQDDALRLSQPPRRYGMCGWLTTYPTT